MSTTGGTLPSRLAGRHVLVVEDEYFLADDIAQALRSAGASVLGPVGDAEEALGLLAAAPAVDAAVLDINLGGLMSYPVADALLQRDVPFVVATGYDRRAIPDRYRHAPHCEKPFDVAAIVRALGSVAGTNVTAAAGPPARDPAGRSTR